MREASLEIILFVSSSVDFRDFFCHRLPESFSLSDFIRSSLSRSPAFAIESSSHLSMFFSQF